jgi:C-terminal processing protease CtpA/Prc
LLHIRQESWDPNSPGGYAPSTDVFLDPTDNVDLAYDGDVILLTSRSTVSAAEIFTMSMMQLPQVTLMGRPTSGELSDILARELPNGWQIGLSNEVYAAPDGVVYEIVGIPPHVRPESELLVLEELFVDERDSWLEEALELASPPLSTVTGTPTQSPSATDTLTGTPSAVPDEGSGAHSLSIVTLWSTALAVFAAALYS